MPAGGSTVRSPPRSDPVARTAEELDPQRRSRDWRDTALRDPAIKVRGTEASALAVPEPEPAHNEPQDIRYAERVDVIKKKKIVSGLFRG